MPNNICPECKTENEPEYRYCKNCGAPITFSAPAAAQPRAEDYAPGGQSTASGGAFIDGNPIENVVTFVGKNAFKIIPKFIKMEEKHTKTEWCWPPFVWGFFLGPLGIAIWLFYRKMYKPACIFGAVSVAAGFFRTLLDTVLGTGGQAFEGIGNYVRSFLETGMFDIHGFYSLLNDRAVILRSFINSFANILYLACAVLAGIFGLYFYKKHAAHKISHYVPFSNDPNYFKIGLAATGGTSAGAAILGAVVISLISGIPEIIADALSLAGGAYGI